MSEMWKVVKDVKLKTTGINHWVYLSDDRMFVGVEVKNSEQSTIPEQLELLEFELQRYLKHLHIGPYHALPQKWRALRSDRRARCLSLNAWQTMLKKNAITTESANWDTGDLTSRRKSAQLER